MSFADKTLTCRDCGSNFVFTTGEQEFYAEKGFTNQPSRCPDCRRAAKSSRGGGDSYSRGGGGGGGFGGGDRQMYAAICSDCGRDTQVPFQPTSGKPVYCSECFRAQRQQSSRW
jgi:CxxC-x17-CxxC domain-containing protein